MNKYVYNAEESCYEIHILSKTPGRSGIVLIDSEDVDKCKRYTWSLGGNSRRPSTNVKFKHGYLALSHYLIGKPARGNMIDHINRNPLDNRKKNLREVSRSVNATNAKVRSDKTQKDLPRGITYSPDNPEPRTDGKGSKSYASFTVQWSVDGKRRTRCFSVRKYGGYEQARQAAIDFRRQKMEEMKI